MPKRTKQEKIMAQYRKRLKLIQQLQEPDRKMEVRNVKQDYEDESEKTLQTSHITPPASNFQSHTSYFVNDLKRSLIFIVSIIALEIAVYFGTINNYFKFLRLN